MTANDHGPSTGDTAAAPRPAGRRLFKRFRGDRRGVAAVEFAVLAIPFFLMIFATIETGIVFLAELTLDQAVDRVGRTVRTGEVQQSGMTEDAFRQRICDNVDFLLDCDDLMIDVATYPNFASIPAPRTNGVLDTSGFGFRPGGAETITAVRAFYRWQIQTDMMRTFLSDAPDGTHLLYAIAAFKTEPF